MKFDYKKLNSLIKHIAESNSIDDIYSIVVKEISDYAKINKNLEISTVYHSNISEFEESNLKTLSFYLKEKLQNIDNLILSDKNKKEKARYQELIEETSDWLWEIGIDGRFTYVSPRCKDLLGYKPEELLGKSAFDLMKKEEAERVEKVYRGFAETKEPFNGMININLHKDGHEIIIESSGKPIYSADGNLIGYRGVDRDITDRKKSEIAFFESETKFRALFENGPIGVAYHEMIYNDEGKAIDYIILDANHTYIEFTGVDPRGKRVTEAFPGIKNDPFDWIGTFDKVLKDDKEIQFQQYLEQNKRWYNIVAYKYRKDHFVVAFIEITRQKKIEEELRKEKERVEKSEKKFKSMTENSSLAIYMSSGIEQKAEYINPAFSNMFGYTIEDVPSASEWWPKAYPDEEYRNQVSNEWQDKVKKAIKNHSEIEPMETVVTCKDGTEKNIRWGYVSTESQNWAFGLDITDSKKSEQILSQRIIALTQPFDDFGSIRFDELFNISDIQKLQDDFAKATNVATIITAPDGQPITKPGNFSRFCGGIIRKNKRGCQNCLKSDSEIGKLSKEGPTIQKCLSGGLWDAGAGISVGGKHIANWLIGQVRDESISADQIRSYAKEIEEDEEEMVKAFLEVPKMSKEKFTNIANMLFTLATQLSTLAFQNVQQARLITERLNSEKELKISRENLKITLDSIGDAVIATDINGNITRMNPVAENLTGWDIESALGNQLPNVFRIINSKTRETIKNPVEKVLESGDIVGLANHTVLLSKNGEEYHIADSGAPIRSEHGETTGIVLVFRDITDEYILQEQLRQSQKLDAIGQLAGGIAHDFNNMLGGILGGIQLLEMSITPNQDTDKYLSILKESTQRATDLTSKLLTFSRREIPDPAPINIHKVVNSTIALLQNTIDRRISIMTNMLAECSTVVGEESQLQSVFLNLGINAAHAMPNGGVLTFNSKVVDISKAYCDSSSFDLQPGNYIEISVKDSGFGIDSKNMEFIFDPFFTTKEQGKGTGLGLAAVYGIMQQHKGSITVNSVVNEGTIFHMLFPLSEEEDETKHIEPKPVMGNGNILLVDDEYVMREIGIALLTEFGYNVVSAENGQEAIDLFQKTPGKFDIVVLDMIMPEMNGHDCFLKLRDIDPELPIILVSGFADSNDINELEELGINGFIQKPYSAARLSKMVAKSIRKTNK